MLYRGGFVFEPPDGMARVARLARRAGFEPRYVDYPTYDLRGAVHYAQRTAQRLRARGRSVFAYGESAGGTLAALLAERGLVRAAAGYSPIPNLLRFANRQPDPDAYKDLIRADDALLVRDSPDVHDSDRPILAIRARRDDAYVRRGMRRWASRDPDVASIEVPGGHVGGMNTAIYAAGIRRALTWLVRRATSERAYYTY
jgi:dienelactone hydrolase